MGRARPPPSRSNPLHPQRSLAAWLGRPHLSRGRERHPAPHPAPPGQPAPASLPPLGPRRPPAEQLRTREAAPLRPVPRPPGAGDSGERPCEDHAGALGPGAPAAAPLGGRWIRERGQVSGCRSPPAPRGAPTPSPVPPGPRGCVHAERDLNGGTGARAPRASLQPPLRGRLPASGRRSELRALPVVRSGSVACGHLARGERAGAWPWGGFRACAVRVFRPLPTAPTGCRRGFAGDRGEGTGRTCTERLLPVAEPALQGLPLLSRFLIRVGELGRTWLSEEIDPFFLLWQLRI